MFEKRKDSDYVCSVWFERNRKSVALYRSTGTLVFSLTDEDVDQAIDDGFLGVPKLVSMSSRALNDSDAWHPYAVAYAREMGMIK